MHFFANTKSFGLLALALPLSVTAQKTFNLFAYGTNGGISAASMFYQNGLVMLSNLTTPHNLTSIYFTSDGDGNKPSAWTVQPNKTVHPDPPFTSGYVALKASTNSSLVQVGNASADALDLELLGQSVFAHVDGKVQNPFYAVATATNGIWQLVWNVKDTHADQLEPVILRLVRPPRHGRD